jgi:hypothetical protein
MPASNRLRSRLALNAIDDLTGRSAANRKFKKRHSLANRQAQPHSLLTLLCRRCKPLISIVNSLGLDSNN